VLQAERLAGRQTEVAPRDVAATLGQAS